MNKSATETRSTGGLLRALAMVLVAQSAGIMLTGIALFPAAVLFLLVYAVSRSEWATSVVSFDSYGLIRLLAYVLPPCLWWWLYTKAMRALADRLNLTAARKELGFPFIGEITFVAGLMGLTR